MLISGLVRLEIAMTLILGMDEFLFGAELLIFIWIVGDLPDYEGM